MPGNVKRVVAHEIADVERFPQRLVRLKRFGMQREQCQGFALAGLHFRARVRRAAAEYT